MWHKKQSNKPLVSRFVEWILKTGNEMNNSVKCGAVSIQVTLKPLILETVTLHNNKLDVSFSMTVHTVA